MSARRTILSLAIASGTLIAGSALGQTIHDEDTKAAGRLKEEVRKQEKGLRPPNEVKEEADTAAADDAYQPKGVEVGSFLLLPKLELDERYTNNVYATAHDRVGDWITSVRPEVALNSRFDRHSLSALGRLERKEFRTYDKESVTNGFAQVSGRYDVTERDNLNAMVSYVSDHDDRGSFDNAGGTRPTPFTYLTFSGSGVVNTGRLTSSLGFIAAQRQWEDVVRDGGIVPTHLRNRIEYEEKLREAYEFFPGYSALVEASLIQRRYQHDADQFGINRDSDGVRLSTGLGVDISQVIRGDFLVGHFRQDYKDNSLTDPSGGFIKAAFNWTPTRMTVIIPTIERSVEETTANRVSSLLRTATSVTVRHELRRNVILGGSAGYAREEQKGGGLTATTHDATLRATYLFTPEVYASSEVSTVRKIANDDGAGFIRNSVMFRLGLPTVTLAGMLADGTDTAPADGAVRPYVGVKVGAGFAQANDVEFQNPRLRSSIGDDYSDTVAFGAASAGVAFSGLPVRAELEYAYRDNAKFSRDDNIGAGAGLPANQAMKVRSKSLMAYGFYDIKTGTALTPFLSGGLGVSFNKAEARQTQPANNWDEKFTGKTRTEFAWGLGAGVGVEVAQSLSLDLGYRFVDLGKFSVGDMPVTGDEDITGRLRSHELYTGLRYTF